MTHRATITLDKEAYSFLLSVATGNRSAFINQLIKKEKSRHLEQAIYRANLEEADDEYYNEELSAWDETLEDGM